MERVRRAAAMLRRDGPDAGRMSQRGFMRDTPRSQLLILVTRDESLTASFDREPQCHGNARDARHRALASFGRMPMMAAPTGPHCGLKIP
jgi:hypothetical protein